MAFTLFTGFGKPDLVDQFWKWFVQNEDRLFAFEENREIIFDELNAAMSNVHADLSFEISPVLPGGKREFVISGGGMKSAFPAVEALYKNAPDLKRWEWIKYRPRRYPFGDIRYGNQTISAQDIHYLLAEDGEKPGIVLFFDGYNEDESPVFKQFGFLYLDQALGEFAVTMQVGFIEFHSRESEYFKMASPLEELPADFDAYWARSAH